MGTSTYATVKGKEHPDLLTVYYKGSDTLSVGDNLCYDQDATVDGTDPADDLGVTVEKPATANLNAYAGPVVEPPRESPGWCKIARMEPGKFVDALVHANATAWTTVLGPADDDYGLVAKSDATFNLAARAIACETDDTSTTAAVKRVKIL